MLWDRSWLLLAPIQEAVCGGKVVSTHTHLFPLSSSGEKLHLFTSPMGVGKKRKKARRPSPSSAILCKARVDPKIRRERFALLLILCWFRLLLLLYQMNTNTHWKFRWVACFIISSWIWINREHVSIRNSYSTHWDEQCDAWRQLQGWEYSNYEVVEVWCNDAAIRTSLAPKPHARATNLSS